MHECTDRRWKKEVTMADILSIFTIDLFLGFKPFKLAWFNTYRTEKSGTAAVSTSRFTTEPYIWSASYVYRWKICMMFSNTNMIYNFMCVLQLFYVKLVQWYVYKWDLLVNIKTMNQL